ncbi:MAG: hypothetical protein ACOWWO_04935 [Peptococcaceae bacterium]
MAMNHEHELVINTLKIHAETAESLKDLSRHNINFQLWLDRTTETIAEACGADSELLGKFTAVRFHLQSKGYTGESSFDYDAARAAYVNGLNKAIDVIGRCINFLEENLAIKIAENSHIRRGAGKEHLGPNIQLSLKDIDDYLEKSQMAESEKGLVKEELQDIYVLLDSGRADKEKIKLYKNKLAGILNRLTIKTGILIGLYQIIDIIDQFTY